MEKCCNCVIIQAKIDFSPSLFLTEVLVAELSGQLP